MSNREQFSGSGRHKELEDITIEEKRLREALENSLSDDRQFYDLARELSEELAKLDSPREGIEKARILASAQATQKKIEATERYRLSSRFIELSKQREDLELKLRKEAQTKHKVFQFPKVS